MRSVVTIIFLALLLTSCSNATLPVPTDITTTKTEIDLPVDPIAQITSTQPPLPSSTPTVESTSTGQPVFHLIQNYSPALSEEFGKDWGGYDPRGLDFNPVSNQIALSGCVLVCDRYEGGYAFLLLLDKDQKQPIIHLQIDPSKAIRDADFTPDGKNLIYTDRDGIKEYNLADNSIRLLWDGSSVDYLPINDISSNGKYLASDINHSLVVFVLDGMQEIMRIPGIYSPSYHVDFFNEGSDRILITRNSDLQEFAIYDVETGKLVREFQFPNKGLVVVSPDGKYIAYAAKTEGSLSLIDVNSGISVWEVASGFKNIVGITFSSTGDLLFTSGSADDGSSFFETTRIFETSSGSIKGTLLSLVNYYELSYSVNPASILTLSGSSLGMWGLETDAIQRMSEVLKEYFDAIFREDYQKAAELTMLDEYAVQELQDMGQDSSNLESSFSALCLPDEVPCLHLGEIARVNASDGFYWNYEAYVTLKQSDGKILLFDGIEPYEFMGIKIDDQGNYKIASLHPGMRYPWVISR